MIEKLKPQDHPEYKWIDEEKCSFRSKKEYLQTEILGFCGCGSPDDVMGYVGSYLDDLANNKFGDYEDIPYMFLAYWADNNGYTEHGSTVRCSWLTDKGKQLLADINWCIKNEILTT